MAESGIGNGARDLDVHSAVKVGVFFLLGAGVLGLTSTVLSPPGVLLNRTGLIVVAASGLVVPPLFARLLWNRLSWDLLYAAAVMVVGAFALGSYFGGPRGEVAVIPYVIVAIYATYYFSTRRAISIVVLIAIAYAVQLVVQEGHEPELPRWLYVVGTLVVCVVFVDSLVRAADRSAAREKAARQAEEAARRELAQLNEALEAKVGDQVTEMQRLGRLRRFLSPNLAEVVVNSEQESFLEPHRREIAVFFIDLRGFTRFASATEPEDVLDVLHSYYDRVGSAFARFEATVGPIQGDGVMAYFNDPFPCADPARKAVEMADAIATSLDELSLAWRTKGHDIGYGMGIAFGYATLGMIGFEGRQDYGPLGTVVNLASRLCDVATPGQILIDRRTASAVSEGFESTLVQTMEIKGFRDPVDVFQVLRGVLGQRAGDSS